MNVFVFSCGRQPPYLCSRRSFSLRVKREYSRTHMQGKERRAPAAEQLQLTSDPKGKKTIAVHKANNAILN